MLIVDAPEVHHERSSACPAGRVSGLQISPAYPGNNGVGFETFLLKFDQVVGDQIRIYGVPGGTHAFISVGELRVYGFR
jgi:hypothetical protein